MPCLHLKEETGKPQQQQQKQQQQQQQQKQQQHNTITLAPSSFLTLFYLSASWHFALGRERIISL